MKLSKQLTLKNCACDSGKPYAACCEPYHLGADTAPNAEALMRSRYTAYVLNLNAYLLQTWHLDTRPTALNLADDLAISLADGVKTQWLGLQVKRVELTNETNAIVEFIARYKIAGKAHQLHEISHFVKLAQYWLYVDGTHPQ